jgi:hypothetical protein
MSIKRQLKRSLSKKKFQDRVIITKTDQVIIYKKSEDFKKAHETALKKYKIRRK